MKKTELFYLVLGVGIVLISFKTDRPGPVVAAISADKMNILYVGLDNPISVSVSGYKSEQLEVKATAGGTLKEFPEMGNYLIKPDGSNREITIEVFAKKTKTPLSARTFRVRKIPHPEVLFGTKSGGRINRGELATVTQINTGLGEGFAFEGIKYTVNSYTFALSPKGGQPYMEQVQGNRITASARTQMNNTHAGDLIVIANVDATGPAGKVILSGVTLIVN